MEITAWEIKTSKAFFKPEGSGTNSTWRIIKLLEFHKRRQTENQTLSALLVLA